MPNFHTKDLNTPTYPCRFGKSSFKFEATSKRGEKLIMSECEGHNLLIKINKNKNGYLVKGDKITRPSSVVILQQVLKDFRDLTKTSPTNSNIDYKKQKSLKVPKYLKDMEYFANEFKSDKEILVEVGFGSGRHLLYQAKNNPNTLFIGIEIHKPSIEQVLNLLKIHHHLLCIELEFHYL